MLLLLASSFSLGILGMIYLLISGIIKFIRHKMAFREQPISWVFMSVLIFFVSPIFMSIQPFMRMGDITIGTVLLAISSFLVPLSSVISLILLINSRKKVFNQLDFWILLMVIQFLLLLIVNGIVPIIMWQ